MPYQKRGDMSNNDYRKYGVFLLASGEKISLEIPQHTPFNSSELNELFDNVEFNRNGTSSFTLKKGQGIKYIVIPSWQNPRWFIPHNKKIIQNIGNIIKPTTVKSRIIWGIAKLFNHIDCIDLIFRDKIYIKESNLEKRYLKPFSASNTFVIYTGAPGIYQKFTVQEMSSSGKILAYFKFGLTSLTRERISAEKSALTFLANTKFNTFKYPSLYDYYHVGRFSIIKQSPAELSYNTMIREFKGLHQRVLEELNNKFSETIAKEHLIENLKKKVNIINNSDIDLINKAKNDISRGIEQLLKLLENQQTLKLSFSHGDFTPWNMFTNNVDLFIFDWEMADFRVQLFDFFNFIYHRNILLGKFSLNQIYKELSFNKEWALSLLNSDTTYKTCHIFFLIDILAHYIEHYIIIQKDGVNNKIEELILKFNLALNYCLTSYSD